MRFKTLKAQVVSVVRSAHAALLVGMLAFSPVAHTLQIKLGSAMRVRTVDDNDLVSVGVLTAGSVVEIPDQYKVLRSDGRIDGQASLNNWLLKSGYSRRDVSRPILDQRKDFYYPVHIVSMAPGSTGKNLLGKTRYMALRVLARSNGRMYISKNSPVYKAKSDLDDVPLDARGEQEEADAEQAAQTEEAKQAARQNAETQDDANVPDYNEQRPQAPSSSDDSTEAVGSPEDCPTCAAASAADQVSSAAEAVQDQAYNASAYGKQGLTSQFASACSSLIKSDGTYGPWGKILIKQLNRHRDDFTARMLPSEARKVCPNFNSFDDEEKMHFWAYVMTATFSHESDCDPTQPARGPDGRLMGLGQMPDSQYRNNKDDQAYHWGSDCAGPMSNVANNIRCSVRRLDALIDNGAGPYQYSGNYWSSLRSEPRGVAHALISQYEKCGAVSFDVPSSRMPGGAVRHHHSKSHKKSKKHRRYS